MNVSVCVCVYVLKKEAASACMRSAYMYGYAVPKADLPEPCALFPTPINARDTVAVPAPCIIIATINYTSFGLLPAWPPACTYKI